MSRIYKQVEAKDLHPGCFIAPVTLTRGGSVGVVWRHGTSGSRNMADSGALRMGAPAPSRDEAVGHCVSGRRWSNDHPPSLGSGRTSPPLRPPTDHPLSAATIHHNLPKQTFFIQQQNLLSSCQKKPFKRSI